ncbi:MAG: sugar ABC transporter permease [Proteobacteria bacterium]|nr:sugar ABC transporter permease [Pseudomonadota bacterium]
MTSAGAQAVPARAPWRAGRHGRRVGFGPTLEAYTYLAPLLVVLVGLAAYPLVDGVYTSLTDRAVASPGRFIGLANFVKLLDDQDYRTAAVNSVLLTAGAVSIKLVIGLAGAVLLTQTFPLRGVVRALAFLPWAVPGLVAALGWRWLLDDQTGAVNALLLASGLAERPVDWLSDPPIAKLSIAIATVWQGFPFFIMMFIAGITTIPAELYEAAAIDGAGPWQCFRRVTLPSIADVIAITVMLSSIWTFNAFNTVFILTGGGPANRTQILPTLAYQYGMQQNQLGQGAAVIASFLPVFLGIIALLTRRMLRDKVT